MLRTHSINRKTAWSFFLAPLVIGMILGAALVWFTLSAQAAPPEPTITAYLDPASLVELMPEPTPAATPEPTPALVSLGTFRATAYCGCEKCCGKWSQYHLTASGTTPEEGRTVAADWTVLPVGTEIYIEDVGWRTVEDTGSGIGGQDLDIYFESHQDALEWGVQEVEVFTCGP